MSENGLPRGWVETTLGDVAILNPPKPSDLTDDTLVSFLPMRAVEAGSGKMDASEGRYWREVRKGYTSFRENDLLFAKITPCMENGKHALAKGLHGGYGAGSTEFHVFRAQPGVEVKLLLYFVQQESFRREARGAMAGAAGQLRVSESFLSNARFPLPPLPEQHRIVDEIEKQFSRLDAGVAALKRTQANLKRYRASVLQAACEGRLVLTEAQLAKSEKREYEPAEILLERILGERRAKWNGKGRYKEPAAPDTNDLPELPEGWCWASVEQMLAEAMCNGLSVKGSDASPGVPALKLNAMGESGFDYTAVRYLPVHLSSISRIVVSTGDFFVSRGNGSVRLVGRGTLAQEPPFPVIFPDTMIRLRLCAEVKSSKWMPLVWQTRGVRKQIETKAKTTAGIWKVSQPDIRSISIPLPPLAEQHRIVAEVERRLFVIDQLESVVEANLKRAERLRQAILKRAFGGKLVAQEAENEAAEELLERISADYEGICDGERLGGTR